MRRSPAVRRLVVATVGGALLLAASGLPAGADSARLADAGWWWRLQAGLGLDLPAPPTVEPGQLPVQGAPDGPVMIAALRFDLPAGTSEGVGATLTLAVAEGSPPVPPGAVILACRPDAAWFGEEAGAWDRRPVSTCDSSVPGSPSDDGESWSFELSLLVEDGVLDVVLVPGSVEGIDGVGSTIDIRFDRPAGSALALSGGGADFELPDLDLGDETAASAGGSAPDLGGSGPAPEPAPAGGSTPSFSPPAVDPGPAPTSGAAGATDRLELGSTSPGPVPPAVVEATRAGARWLGFVLLAGAAAAALWSIVRPAGGATGLRLAGASGAGAPPPGGEPMGGIGRFARPRAGHPPSLR